MKIPMMLAGAGTLTAILFAITGCATTPPAQNGADNAALLIEELETHAALSEWQRNTVAAMLQRCGRSDVITIDYTSRMGIQWVQRYIDNENVVAVECSLFPPESSLSDTRSLQYRVHGPEAVASFHRMRSMMLEGPAVEFSGGNCYRAHFTADPLVVIEAMHPADRIEEGSWAPSLNGSRDESRLNAIDAICINSYVEMFDNVMRAISMHRAGRE